MVRLGFLLTVVANLGKFYWKKWNLAKSLKIICISNAAFQCVVLGNFLFVLGFFLLFFCKSCKTSNFEIFPLFSLGWSKQCFEYRGLSTRPTRGKKSHCFFIFDSIFVVIRAADEIMEWK